MAPHYVFWSAYQVLGVSVGDHGYACHNMQTI